MNSGKKMFNFLKKFVFRPAEVGAIAPSSQELSDLIVSKAELEKARSVVELGSGTGVFTERILGNINKSAVFFSIEINPFFVSETRKNCPSATIYEGSAEDIGKYLKKHRLLSCDRIISGLPWAVFDKQQQEKILKAAVKALSSKGKFLTFAYTHSLILPSGKKFKSLLKQHFSTVKTTEVIWKNLPPAFVYVCYK